MDWKKNTTSCGWDEQRCVLTGINTAENTPICGSHSSVISRLSCCFFQFFSTWGISFSFPHPAFFSFFNSPDLFQILMVLRLACYYLQLQNKGRLLNSVLRGRAKLFWEGCLPNAWVAGLKGGEGSGEIMLGAEGWRAHSLWQLLCSRVYFYAT